MGKYTLKDYANWATGKGEREMSAHHTGIPVGVQTEQEQVKPVDNLIWWPIFFGLLGGFIATSQAAKEGNVTRKYWNIAAIVTAIGLVILIPLMILTIHAATAADPTVVSPYYTP
jgi:uncharacterized membrane protein